MERLFPYDCGDRVGGGLAVPPQSICQSKTTYYGSVTDTGENTANRRTKRALGTHTFHHESNRVLESNRIVRGIGYMKT